MPESTPSSWGTPPPEPAPTWSGGPFSLSRPLPPLPPPPTGPLGAPAPAGVPQPPAKAGSHLRIVPTLLLLLILAVIVTFAFVLPAIESSRWKVGACLDYYPVGVIELDVDASVVDCAGDGARSVIVGVLGGDATLDDCRPLGAIARYVRNDTMYCIVEL